MVFSVANEMLCVTNTILHAKIFRDRKVDSHSRKILEVCPYFPGFRLKDNAQVHVHACVIQS